MEIEQQAEELVKQLRELFAKLPQEQRFALWKNLMEGWCDLCGQSEPCYCDPCYDE